MMSIASSSEGNCVSRPICLAKASGDAADAWVSWTVDEVSPGLCKVTLTHDELDPVGDGEEWALLLSGLKTAVETGLPLTRLS